MEARTHELPCSIPARSRLSRTDRRQLGGAVDKLVEFSLPKPESPPDSCGGSGTTLPASDIVAMELDHSALFSLTRSPQPPTELALRDAPTLARLTIFLRGLAGSR